MGRQVPFLTPCNTFCLDGRHVSKGRQVPYLSSRTMQTLTRLNQWDTLDDNPLYSSNQQTNLLKDIIAMLEGSLIWCIARWTNWLGSTTKDIDKCLVTYYNCLTIRVWITLCSSFTLRVWIAHQSSFTLQVWIALWFFVLRVWIAISSPFILQVWNALRSPFSLRVLGPFKVEYDVTLTMLSTHIHHRVGNYLSGYWISMMDYT